MTKTAHREGIPMRFTLDTTTGYTQEQLDALTAEFAARWNAGEYRYVSDEPLDQHTAWKQFADEVAGR